MKNIHTYYFIFLLCIVQCGCDKNVQTTIPKRPVSLELVILRDAPELDIIGNYKFYTKPQYLYQYLGYGGLLIYHDFNDKIVCFDISCPYEVKPDIRVDSISAIGEAVCRNCLSKFDIGYGSGAPTQGPATAFLRKYNVYYTGAVLRISQ